MSENLHLIGLDSSWDSNYDLIVRAVAGEQVGTRPDGLPIMKPSQELEFEASYNKYGEERSVRVYLDRYDVFELISKLNEWYHQ